MTDGAQALRQPGGVRARVVKTVLRAGWACAGLVLSAPAFLPPLAGAVALLAMGAMSGTSFTHVVAHLWRDPRGFAWLSVAVIYAVYWACVGFLVVQFVRGKEWSAVPLAIVATAMATTLVALQPWHAPNVPFALGPFALLHVAYMATIAWPSLKQSGAI